VEPEIPSSRVQDSEIVHRDSPDLPKMPVRPRLDGGCRVPRGQPRVVKVKGAVLDGPLVNQIILDDAVVELIEGFLNVRARAILEEGRPDFTSDFREKRGLVPGKQLERLLGVLARNAISHHPSGWPAEELGPGEPVLGKAQVLGEAYADEQVVVVSILPVIPDRAKLLWPSFWRANLPAHG